MFGKVEIVPAYKTVSNMIEHNILSGRLNPGDPLPTESEMARQFGLTRHTVREGIRIVEQSGLVRREAGRRLFVALPHHAELASRASRALVMQRVTFRNLWEASLDLEPPSAERAAERATKEIIEKLRANIQAMEQALRAEEDIVELDIEFHSLIAEANNNRALLLAREPISLLFYPALKRLFNHPKTRTSAPKRLLDAHRKIADAIERRDSEYAYEWMRKHILDFRRGYDYCNLDIDAEVSLSGNAEPLKQTI